LQVALPWHFRFGIVRLQLRVLGVQCGTSVEFSFFFLLNRRRSRWPNPTSGGQLVSTPVARGFVARVEPPSDFWESKGGSTVRRPLPRSPDHSVAIMACASSFAMTAADKGMDTQTTGAEAQGASSARKRRHSSFAPPRRKSIVNQIMDGEEQLLLKVLGCFAGASQGVSLTDV